MYDGVMTRVLLIEDEEGIADVLKRHAVDYSWEIVHAPDLDSARKAFESGDFAAVLLDLNLPDGSGLDFCREIRAQSTIPILMLTARRDEIDRVLGLELGADDYIVKPFSPREVMARISAVLRRSSWSSGPEENEEHIIRWLDLQIDESRFEVTAAARSIRLTKTEFQLLLTLVRHPGQVFPRQALIDSVWNGAFIQDRVVDSVIARLRRKLGNTPDGHPYIRTVHGIGYAAGD